MSSSMSMPRGSTCACSCAAFSASSSLGSFEHALLVSTSRHRDDERTPHASHHSASKLSLWRFAFNSTFLDLATACPSYARTGFGVWNTFGLEISHIAWNRSGALPSSNALGAQGP
jgi:hypothetical protein